MTNLDGDEWRYDIVRPATRVTGVVVLFVAISSCTSGGSSPPTYADEDGRLFYETDCPEVDPVLLSVPDGLPSVEATTLEAVEALAERAAQYRVIPRNGWVWERLDDGSIRVFQTDDYMLEAEIETTDDCPTFYAFPGGIPVAYVLRAD